MIDTGMMIASLGNHKKPLAAVFDAVADVIMLIPFGAYCFVGVILFSGYIGALVTVEISNDSYAELIEMSKLNCGIEESVAEFTENGWISLNQFDTLKDECENNLSVTVAETSKRIHDLKLAFRIEQNDN